MADGREGMERLAERAPILKELSRGEELVWVNPALTGVEEAVRDQELSMRDIDAAEARLERFAPLIARCFLETRDRGGLIESDLRPIPQMRAHINTVWNAGLEGTLLLKEDSHLPVAGSVKARGGIYEVLKHTEELALAHGLISPGKSYEALASVENRAFFGQYTIQVGSTGNLGMSIGIMGAALGFRVVVHMSADAQQWKKELLRRHGVTVIEYQSDYSEAVQNGKRMSQQDPKSYFIDDENSRDLFLGYAVAAKRIVPQLRALDITVDADHPLFVYIPCGVGGAPGGVSFGLKQIFGDAVHCFFVEPAQSPCMLAGMATRLHSRISVEDIGLSGRTRADGLAVRRPSGFVGRVMEPLLSGIFTVRDSALFVYLRALWQTESIFLEPSACAAFAGPVRLHACEGTRRYIRKHGLRDRMAQSAHIVWATGGSLVPASIREQYRNTQL